MRVEMGSETRYEREEGELGRRSDVRKAGLGPPTIEAL